MGSSKFNILEQKGSKDGMLNNRKKANPLMHDWNKVVIKYCDGGTFAGDNEDHGLYFKG